MLNRGFTGLIKQIGTIFLHAEIAEAHFASLLIYSVSSNRSPIGFHCKVKSLGNFPTLFVVKVFSEIIFSSEL